MGIFAICVSGCESFSAVSSSITLPPHRDGSDDDGEKKVPNVDACKTCLLGEIDRHLQS